MLSPKFPNARLTVLTAIAVESGDVWVDARMLHHIGSLNRDIVADSF
jgi:hypothetical protein